MSRITAPRSAGQMWPYTDPARGTAVRLVWQQIASFVARALTAARERQRMRRAERELTRLDDRMLKDIGLTRSEIGSMVRHGRGRRTAARLEL